MDDDIAPETAAALPPEPAAGHDPVDVAALVERWWNDFFPGSAVAQDPRAWSTAYAAKEDLKRRLMEGK
jgi:hypothetical protein